MKESLIGDILKKTSQNVVERLFFTEDAVRRTLKDLKLPTETVNVVLTQIKSSREEISKKLIGEVAKFLAKINLSEELRDIFYNSTIEIKAELNFKEKVFKKKATLISKNKGKAKEKESSGDESDEA